MAKVVETRNSKTLADFSKFCKANPDLRFWQALRNWSGYNFVFVADDWTDIHDTFFWEGKEDERVRK